jgi:hypothetical protein
MTQPLEHVSFDNPDEVREGENWRLEFVNLAGDAQVGRIAEPRHPFATPAARWMRLARRRQQPGLQPHEL